MTTIEPGDDLARQTAQAKLLREARDQLAAHAAALAEKKDRKGLARMGIPKTPGERINRDPKHGPAHLVDDILQGTAFTTVDLAEVLGVSLLTLRGWTAPAGTSVQREMPKTAKLLLDRILADLKGKA